jgi:hypothetical protein
MKIAQNSEQNSSKTVFCKKNKQRKILCLLHASPAVTTQDFTNFWGKIFVFVLLEMIEIHRDLKTY